MKATKIIISAKVEKIIADKLNHYSNEQFIKDAKIYIKAIKERRMICLIKSVSASGMSRILKFSSCEKYNKTNYDYRDYSCLFIALGYTEVRDKDGFRINGCGMNMVFYTNYSIIRNLKAMGFMDEKEMRNLEQMIPNVL